MEHFGIDIGNSRVKIYRLPAAVLMKGALPPVSELTEIVGKPWDETTTADLPQKAQVEIVSVRPAVTTKLKQLLTERGCQVRNWTAADLPIKNPYDDPSRLGPDRPLAAWAAREIFGAPVIVVDAGTALTVDLVARSGDYAGGAIAPGFNMLAEALGQGGAMLQRIDQTNENYPGTGTVAALELGVTAAFAGALNHLVTWARQIEAQAPLVMTGGDAARGRQLFKAKECFEAPLLLIGLILLARLPKP